MARHTTIRRGWPVALAALVAALAPRPAAAQATTPGISLTEAVRLTLEKAPVIQLANENVHTQEATLRVARGAFDSSLRVGPLWEHREDVTVGSILQQEQLKRAISSSLSHNFAAVAAAFDEQVKNGRGDLPYCPTDSDYTVYVVRLPGSGLPVPVCRSASQNFEVASDAAIQGISGVSSSDLLRRSVRFDPLSILETQRRLATLVGVQVGSLVLDVHERTFETLRQLQAASNDIAVRTALIYERLGALPTYQYSNTASLFGQFTKLLGNGTLLQFQGTFDGRGAFFRDKPLDPAFGGRDATNRFGSRLEAFWVQPLKRGRGAATVRAPERAAARNIQATQHTYQQATADQTLVSVEAYFDLVAAQESFGLIQASLQNQRQILENTIKLVAAGDVARVDIVRARARTAEVETQLASARLDVVAAQARLAAATGLANTDMGRMVAADGFPARPADLDVDALARDATTRRADVRAATATLDISKILVTAAHAEARSRFDLTFHGGFAQTYYGPAFRSLPDEYRNTPGILSSDAYAKYYSFSGIGRAFTQRWQPVAAIQGFVELPFRNNDRLGRLATARAAVADSEVRLADLDRVIRTNVPKFGEEIRRTRAEWEQRQETVIQYEQTWDSAQRMRAAGEMTLIDMLLTEQQLTQARQQLVQAKHDYAVAVARFKRESGTLVAYGEDWRTGQPDLAGLVAAR